MGHRLSKIYTRTGDKGTTGLGDGSRVSKDDSRVDAYGETDELNSVIGLLLCEPLSDQLQTWLSEIQHDLFDVGAELCIPGHVVIKQEAIDTLENQIEEMNQDLPPLKEFILPGGNRAASLCHLARTTCRRAERRTVTLANQEDSINTLSVKYLNRLSDWLFVTARVLARQGGGKEVLWNPKRNK
ncbi:MAG: cob(I)yrinic acid a,c-diamide adenosyltransferase [Pseudomonadales bacterium]|nr:cob(I)yrinic acid a,c-diamide adenosyltransferase [Pseudomonadales bacterium]